MRVRGELGIRGRVTDWVSDSEPVPFFSFKHKINGLDKEAINVSLGYYPFALFYGTYFDELFPIVGIFIVLYRFSRNI